MKKYLNLTLTALILASTSVAAFATITSAGGGTWDYGSNNSICWSKYTHNELRHGSTVINAHDEDAQDDGVDAGEQSWAETTAYHDNPAKRNRAYWHRCGIDKKCGYTQD